MYHVDGGILSDRSGSSACCVHLYICFDGMINRHLVSGIGRPYVRLSTYPKQDED